MLGAARCSSIALCFALLAAAVDPDELLRALRRVSFRSALTAALADAAGARCSRATRRRSRDAQRCRPRRAGRRGSRVLRAVTTGALDRALDVAATLEVRGYGARPRPAGGARPWSRHDLAFAASAVALVALAVGAAARPGSATFDAVPGAARAGRGARGSRWPSLIVAVALAPFADRRGIER